MRRQAITEDIAEVFQLGFKLPLDPHVRQDRKQAYTLERILPKVRFDSPFEFTPHRLDKIARFAPQSRAHIRRCQKDSRNTSGMAHDPVLNLEVRRLPGRFQKFPGIRVLQRLKMNILNMLIASI